MLEKTKEKYEKGKELYLNKEYSLTKISKLLNLNRGRLSNYLKDVKYTFIIPIQKGWVTAKFWEMINYGIIPFMHPYYDQQKHIPCPDFLRVNSPEELLEKINYLEDNPEEYKKLLNELSLMLKDEYYDGTFINNLIIDGINKLKGTKRLKGEK